MPHILTGEGVASLLALTFLEIVLSVDNIVFVAVAVERLAEDQRGRGRQIGLALAMVLRVLMLWGLVWITRLDIVVFHLFARDFSIKALVLLAGGLFLLWKGTSEIHDTLEEEPDEPDDAARVYASLSGVIVEIAVINIVFSLDSVVTAVGMTSDLPVMIVAVVIATGVMLFAAKPVGAFIRSRPTTKMLALSFILLVGVALVADGVGFHLPRGYLYFAIAFSLFVEALNGAYRRAVRKRRRD